MPRLAATLAPVALVAASLGATLPGCGGGDASPDAAATADAIVRPDAIAGCVTWARVERAADTIASIDPAPVNTDRTTRVALVAEVAACDQPAMPIVRYDPATRRAFAPMAVLEPAITCPPSTQTLTRPVELRLPSPGTWTIYAGADASAPSLTIDVASPPDRACGTAGACELDCDCAAGERCLGGVGLGGAFRACGVPCELDRDCGGDARCISQDDGLEWVCQAGLAECDGQIPCPDGYVCDAGACAPDFTLGSGTRVACGCDADCDAPLRCVLDGDDAGAHCELACPTAGGGWCQGAHVCGLAADDLAGLAHTDGVCVWLGE